MKTFDAQYVGDPRWSVPSPSILHGAWRTSSEPVAAGEAQEIAVADGVARELAAQAGRDAWRASHAVSSAVERLDGYRATSRADREALARQVVVLWLLLAATWVPLVALLFRAWH